MSISAEQLAARATHGPEMISGDEPLEAMSATLEELYAAIGLMAEQQSVANYLREHAAKLEREAAARRFPAVALQAAEAVRRVRAARAAKKG